MTGRRGIFFAATKPSIQKNVDHRHHAADPGADRGRSLRQLWRRRRDRLQTVGRYDAHRQSRSAIIFSPGYKGQIKEHPDYYLAFFAHPYNVAEDGKGDRSLPPTKPATAREMKLLYELKNVKYKKSTIPISDDFIQGKVAPLLNDVGARQGSPKDIFIKVNKDLRKENEEKIPPITREVDADASFGKALLASSAIQKSKPTSPTREPTSTKTKRSIPPIMSATIYRSPSITPPKPPTAASSLSSAIWESTATRSSSITASVFSPSTRT